METVRLFSDEDVERISAAARQVGVVLTAHATAMAVAFEAATRRLEAKRAAAAQAFVEACRG